VSKDNVIRIPTSLFKPPPSEPKAEHEAEVISLFTAADGRQVTLGPGGLSVEGKSVLPASGTYREMTKDGLSLEVNLSTQIAYLRAPANKGTPAWKHQLVILACLMEHLARHGIAFNFYTCKTLAGDTQKERIDCVYFDLKGYIAAGILA
jgi:hypothetical protein